MVDIPTERSIRRVTPSASRPRSAGPAPILGQTLSAFGGDIGRAGAHLDNIVERQKQSADKATAFETQRRFLEFAASQQSALEADRESAAPGAFGFSEAVRAKYIDSAKEFRKTIPQALQGEYETRLFSVEDQLVSGAADFESTARRKHYGASVDDGLTRIEGQLFARPDSYEQTLAEGMELINAIPDDGFSQIEKEELRRGWEQKAKLAVLNGVSPEERVRLLGGIDSPQTDLSADLRGGITKGIDGGVRSTIVDAAQRHGVSEEAMLVTAWLESRGNPKAQNPKSSAGGLFQQIDSNAADYGVADRLDAKQSADGAARFMADNTRALRRVLGREPTTGELYLAHQQGPGGATKLLSNPDALAKDIVGLDAVRLNGGKADMTAGEFAGIWLKKAGDTHVPSGGLANASFDPSRADPRFVNLGYMDAQKVIQSAQGQIASALIERDREMAAQRELANAQLGISVTEGVATRADVDDALARGLIDPTRYESLSEQIIKRDDAQRQEGEAVQSFLSKTEAGEKPNGFNADDKKAVDAIDKAVQQRVSAEGGNVRDSQISLLPSTQIAPQSLVDDLRRGIRTGDPSTLEAASRALRIAPNAFDGRDGGAEIVKAVQQFNALARTGRTAEQIAAAMQPDPNREARAEFLEADIKKELKNVGATPVLDELDSFMPFDRPAFAANIEALASRDYATLYRQARLDGMKPGDAKDYAAKMLTETGMYGVSEFSEISLKEAKGVRRREGKTIFDSEASVMRFPPENFYPEIDGGHDYIKKDLKASLESLPNYGGGVAMLLPDETETEAVVRRIASGQGGELPGYVLYYEDANGAFQQAYWRMEQSDIDALVKKQSANRKASAAQARQRAWEDVDIGSTAHPLTGRATERPMPFQ